MEVNSSCFFCGKRNPKNNSHEENSYNNSLDCNDENAFIKSDLSRKCVTKITNYLKVARETVNMIDDEFNLIVCSKCWSISGKLGTLCEELEVVQMKIKYFLNLLTDQILANNNSKTTTKNGGEDKLIDDQFAQSKFQEKFHERCLSKLANIPVIPKLRISRCKAPKKLDHEQPWNDLDETNNCFDGDDVCDSTLETFQDSSEPSSVLELCSNFKCKYCPMTLTNRGNLEKHMKAIHENKSSSSNLKVKTCEYCGAMINYKNLSAHKRKVHGIGRSLPANLEIRRMKRCVICGKLISMQNASGHKKLCRSKGKIGIQKNLREDGEDVEKYLIKKKFKCENCKMWFRRKGDLIRHFGLNELCKSNGKNIQKIENARAIRCPNNCGESFTVKASLKRHLKRTCRLNKSRDNSNEVEIKIICGSENAETEVINGTSVKDELDI